MPDSESVIAAELRAIDDYHYYSGPDPTPASAYRERLHALAKIAAELTRDLQQAKDHVGGLTAALVVKKQQLSDRDREIEGLRELLKSGLNFKGIPLQLPPIWTDPQIEAALASRQAGKERGT